MLFALPFVLLPVIVSGLVHHNISEVEGLYDASAPNAEACLAAFSAPIDCTNLPTTDWRFTSTKEAENYLDSICTDSCAKSVGEWVKGGEGCSGDDFINFFGLYKAGGRMPELETGDIQQYVVTASYWTFCLTGIASNSQESKYCALRSENRDFNGYAFTYSSDDPNMFCGNDCATQMAYLWSPVNVTYKLPKGMSRVPEDEDSVPLVSLKEVCPSLDTSNYPQRLEQVSGATTNNNNNGGTDDTKTGESGQNNTDGKPADGADKNAAARNGFQPALILGAVMLLAIWNVV